MGSRTSNSNKSLATLVLDGRTVLEAITHSRRNSREWRHGAGRALNSIGIPRLPEVQFRVLVSRRELKVSMNVCWPASNRVPSREKKKGGAMSSDQGSNPLRIGVPPEVSLIYVTSSQ